MIICDTNMNTSMMTRNKGQVYSVGNYLMTGKVLGKGHFAKVEEATHRIIGKKVAIKIIDLTYIKEEYARRNLHREPKVMARLRHPCIAALYETMMHGPRLYVVMEAAGGGDLCAYVLGARGAGGRGLGESRAKALSAQLVSAVKHMHARGVVHRDLKMENIMLDSTKQFIKIVDFGLSNLWMSGGGLRTPCGSLEYAAPELFIDGRKYGPEVDLWSIGVIVYGMVTGTLPFGSGAGGGGGGGGGAEGESKSRPQLRAAIARGFGRKQRMALLSVSPDCRGFIQQLLDPNVDTRMKIEETARHRWIKKPGMKMKTDPLDNIDPKMSREMFRQIADLCGQSVVEVQAAVRAAPYGALGGLYNVKTHSMQLHALPPDCLWGRPDPVTPAPVAPRGAGAGAAGAPGDSLPSIAEHPRRPGTANTRPEFYRRAGDGPPSWRSSGAIPSTPPARILLQSNATSIKRASLGSIVSPHSSTNSQCKSERSTPVKWFSTRSTTKELTPLQRLRRTAPIK